MTSKAISVRKFFNASHVEAFLSSRSIANCLLCTLVFLAIFFQCRTALATGEILNFRAPEEVIEGDDISILVSVSAREKNVDRSIVLAFPNSWKMKRAYSVEAGSEHPMGLVQFSEIQHSFAKEAGHEILALADTNSEFDPGAAGVAYFIIFSTSPTPTTQPSVTVKAALVERSSPNATPEIDKRTKKAKPVNTAWRMTYPSRSDFSFASVMGRKLVQTIKLLRITRTSRALDLSGSNHAAAQLSTSPEILKQFFASPFSLEFWFKTTEPFQPILVFEQDKGSRLEFGTNVFGQLRMLSTTQKNSNTLWTSQSVPADGIWHHVLISKERNGAMRLFLDAQLILTPTMDPALWSDVVGLAIGSENKFVDFSIDELRLRRGAINNASEYQTLIVRAARDTLTNAFSIFHFDEFGPVAHSFVLVAPGAAGKAPPVPVQFELDSNARIEQTSSPVQPDQVQLNVDLVSPTRINISWRTTSELDVKQYQLERRVGSFGAFEKVLTSEAKHGIRVPKRGASIVSHYTYSATEELPRLTGDIELYYRLAIVRFGESAKDYSEPIKLEYGADRDVFVEQNQPNPFNPTTSIAFRATKSEVVKLAVYDIIGREVAVLVNGKVDAGRHVYTIDATNWPGGIYFYKVKSPRTTVTRKMVLAK